MDGSRPPGLSAFWRFWGGLAALPRRLLLGLIHVYQRFISPLTPPTCRFTPTCSEYARQALLRHGAARGGLLTGWRLLRCQPLCRGGHDPVPADWRRAWRRRPPEHQGHDHPP